MNQKHDIEKLTIEQNLLVLGWMVECIDQGMKRQVQARAYQQFVQALSRGTTFSVKEVWDQLPQSTKEHFDHASDILLHLQDEIERFEDELEAEADQMIDDPPDADPFDEKDDENEVEP